jgi:hypothetical protein
VNLELSPTVTFDLLHLYLGLYQKSREKL